jgi:flagellar biosynthesis protein FlhF
MPLETYTGLNVTRLLAKAQVELGTDAVVVQVNRSSLPGGVLGFQLTAADATTAMGLATTAIDAESVPETTAQLDEKLRRGKQLVIAVVGPTGAGKTTTIAKLANHPEAFGGRKVGLLCLDTFKVGGVEQLRNFAKLQRHPVEVAYDGNDLSRAMRRLKSQEVILADTAGRSPSNQEDECNLKELLQQLAPDEVHLVVPAGLNPEYAKHLITKYRAHGITHLIGTKLDEFSRDRSVLELAAQEKLAVRWLTHGQAVPLDLRLVGDQVVASESLPPSELQLEADPA